MGKTLIIVESPNKVKTIKGFLGNEYIVIATVGHFRKMDDKVNGNGIGDDFIPKFIPIEGKQDIPDKINEMAKYADKILIATDPDREGEAIAWHVWSVLNKNFRPKSRRITFNEITKNAVLKAIDKPRDIDQGLVNAQLTRQMLDKKLGYDLSNCLRQYVFSKHLYKRNDKWSAGRVQSVGLMLSKWRDDEILNFKETSKFKLGNIIDIDNNKFHISYCGDKVNEYDNIDQLIESLGLQAVENINFVFKRISKLEPKKLPPLKPFTTSSLLQVAIKKIKLDAKQVQKCLQELFEGIEIDGVHTSLITYPRTDSFAVSDEFVDAAQNFVKINFKEPYWRNYKQFDDNAQSQAGHECLRVTDLTLLPDSLVGKINENNLEIYKIIYSRTLGCFLSSPIKELTELFFEQTETNFSFKSTVSNIVFDGYKILEVEKNCTN